MVYLVLRLHSVLRISKRRHFNLLDEEEIEIIIYYIKLEIYKISNVKKERERGNKINAEFKKEKNISSKKLEIGRSGTQNAGILIPRLCRKIARFEIPGTSIRVPPRMTFKSVLVIDRMITIERARVESYRFPWEMSPFTNEDH